MKPMQHGIKKDIDNEQVISIMKYQPTLSNIWMVINRKSQFCSRFDSLLYGGSKHIGLGDFRSNRPEIYHNIIDTDNEVCGTNHSSSIIPEIEHVIWQDTYNEILNFTRHWYNETYRWNKDTLFYLKMQPNNPINITRTLSRGNSNRRHQSKF